MWLFLIKKRPTQMCAGALIYVERIVSSGICIVNIVLASSRKYFVNAGAKYCGIAHKNRDYDPEPSKGFFGLKPYYSV